MSERFPKIYYPQLRKIPQMNSNFHCLAFKKSHATLLCTSPLTGISSNEHIQAFIRTKLCLI